MINNYEDRYFPLFYKDQKEEERKLIEKEVVEVGPYIYQYLKINESTYRCEKANDKKQCQEEFLALD